MNTLANFSLLVARRATLVVAFGFLSRNFWEDGGDLRIVLCHSMNAG